eukprot:TRINITY_DN4539_c0_g1_i1.p2 TRINITY_DN4539_c0_g1~~TRINITY_DN4539_c0_g1_i1.p2  ORF type:complete len:127 (+),score=17.59 TRINITY_DN4539_c0_g1_i1:838-1218(+)
MMHDAKNQHCGAKMAQASTTDWPTAHPSQPALALAVVIRKHMPDGKQQLQLQHHDYVAVRCLHLSCVNSCYTLHKLTKHNATGDSPLKHAALAHSSLPADAGDAGGLQLFQHSAGSTNVIPEQQAS